MKKLILLLFTITLITACDNEPIDASFTGQGQNNGGNNGGGNQNGGAFALSGFTYDKFIDTGFGISSIETDFNINSSGLISSQETTFEVLGTSIDAAGPVIRDNDGKIIETFVTDGTNTLNTTSINYNGSDIVQIIYQDNQYPDENYTYNFEHNGSSVTRTEVGATESTIFTFNSEGFLITRETLDNGTSIRVETFEYDSNNNLTSTVITGDGARTITYTYDDKTNPLKALFEDIFLYQLFNDNYDDQFEHWNAILGSTNNLLSATTPEGPSDLTVQYDAQDRIISRSGSINSALLNAGSGDITTDEIFNYVN